jgi:hypothetical protein
MTFRYRKLRKYSEGGNSDIELRKISTTTYRSYRRRKEEKQTAVNVGNDSVIN